MQRILCCLTIRFLILVVVLGGTARAEPAWLQLPPTPHLPGPTRTGYAEVNGVRIWFATFGHGQPVILLHGGLANSNYWDAWFRSSPGITRSS